MTKKRFYKYVLNFIVSELNIIYIMLSILSLIVLLLLIKVTYPFSNYIFIK